MGKGMEVTKYTEKLVPSTRFVAVDGVAPTVSEMSFVAPSASVIGDVSIGKESRYVYLYGSGTVLDFSLITYVSVWYGAVLRGDVNKLTVGSQTSIGDRAVVHVAKIQGDFATHIGDSVTIGAGAIVHAATLEDSVVIGEAAQVLDGSTVRSNSIVAPAAVVTPGTTVASGELWSGSPAKKERALTKEEIAGIKEKALEVAMMAAKHVVENEKTYEQILEEDELADIDEFLDESAPRKPDHDVSGSVLGEGQPGRIFRSTLSHPEELSKQQKQ